MSSDAVRAEDRNHLLAALELAARGAGRVSPNPMVGAVVTRDGSVVGEGSHVHAERDHAEIIALRGAGERARGGTLYVTLEPCSTEGRTPPCTRAVTAAGVSRVVACMADPNPRHAGRGFAVLRRAGVQVDVGQERLAAIRLNERFCKWVTTGRPHVTVKLAASLDGRVAAASGQSQWITGEASREHVHELRRAADAVICGVGTVVADDPRLTARPAAGTDSQPLRCVIDPTLRTPVGARLLASDADDASAGPVVLFAREGLSADPELSARRQALIAAGAEIVELPSSREDGDRLELEALVAHLGGERGVQGLLVEGGGTTAGLFVAAGVVDVVLMHFAPMLLGGSAPFGAFAGFSADTLAERIRLRRLRPTALGDDVALEARVEGGFDPEVFERQVERLERVAAEG